jgi:hypothetical protein
VPKFHDIGPHPVRKTVNFGKPVDQGTEFSAKCLEMSLILPFLPLQPGPKCGEKIEGVKKRISASSSSDFNQPPSQQRQDRSAWQNMKRMTATQMEAWRAYYGPLDRQFHDANLQGEALVRWKHQRYLRNYLACVKGVDESVGRLMDTLRELKLEDNTVVI